jgi:pimeloyl-ACP methyl ester carboxylesterase
VIYFGGNSEDVSVNMPSLAEEFPESAIYLLHYRGFGGSSGSPSEAALFADGLMLFDEVHSKHSEIVVIGRSLGSGVAVYVASRRPVARLVLVTPFDSVVDIAARLYPFLPVRWLLRDKFESWRFAPQVTASVLMVAAERDEVVPRASTELLYSRFKRGLATLKVLGGTHNTVSESAEYMPLLRGLR